MVSVRTVQPTPVDCSLDATSYLVELASDAGFVSIVGSQNNAATSADFGELAIGTYFWRVIASGGCGPGPVSAVRSFTVDNVIFIDGFGSGDLIAWSPAFPQGLHRAARDPFGVRSECALSAAFGLR